MWESLIDLQHTENILVAYANRKGSDQPLHFHSRTRVFAFHTNHIKTLRICRKESKAVARLQGSLTNGFGSWLFVDLCKAVFLHDTAQYLHSGSPNLYQENILCHPF